MTGIVIEFDAHVGLGVVESESGERYGFHCTQIANGTREIAAGSPVSFVVHDRPKGQEAFEVTGVTD